jgi:hypothetical protein
MCGSHSGMQARDRSSERFVRSAKEPVKVQGTGGRDAGLKACATRSRRPFSQAQKTNITEDARAKQVGIDTSVGSGRPPTPLKSL